MRNNLDNPGNALAPRKTALSVGQLKQRQSVADNAPSLITAQEESEAGYIYTATDRLGNRWTDMEIPIPRRAIALERLSAGGMTVERLQPRSLRKAKKGKPKAADWARLARDFAELWEAGSTPIPICEKLAYEQENLLIRYSLREAATNIFNGQTLFDAFFAAKMPDGSLLYPLGFLYALKLGEVGTATNFATGKKESAVYAALINFAVATERGEKIRGQITAALRYPGTLFVLVIAILIGMSIYVTPTFKDMYVALLPKDNELPMLTQILVSISDFLLSWWGIISGGAAAFAVAWVLKWLRSEKGKDVVGRRIIRLPYFGEFIRAYIASQLLRNLAMLSEGIQTQSERFREAAKTTENPVYREMLLNVEAVVADNSPELVSVLAPYSFLMGSGFSSVVAAADESGDPSKLFHGYAGVLENKAEEKLKTFLFFVENYAIVPVAGVIMFVLAGLYLPMFEIISRLANK